MYAQWWSGVGVQNLGLGSDKTQSPGMCNQACATRLDQLVDTAAPETVSSAGAVDTADLRYKSRGLLLDFVVDAEIFRLRVRIHTHTRTRTCGRGGAGAFRELGTKSSPPPVGSTPKNASCAEYWYPSRPSPT